MMASLHVRAWQAAYRGLMPQAYLDGLVITEWADVWRQRLSRPDADPVLVAIADDRLAGFVSYGRDRDGRSGGELYALNVDPDSWGGGVGAALLSAAQQELAALGHTDASLWVVPGNERARRFYERNGWRATSDERTEDVLGVPVADLRYERELP